MISHRWVHRLLLGIALAAAALASAHAQPPPATTEAAKGPPPGFVAPPLPKPDETNAERAKSQPGNNAPFWREVRKSGEQQGITSLPGPEMGTLIQRFVQYPGSRYTTAGEAWREVRNRWIIPYGGALIAVVLVAVALFHWRKGPLGGKHADVGRKIERFTPFERGAHWVNAIAFAILAISGLAMAFGKFVLLPVLGLSLNGWLSYALKTLHNLFGPLFAVSLLIVIVTFLRDELPRPGDLEWLRKGGGMLSGAEVPSHRFNAGEKVLFWIAMVALGAIAVASGLYLDKVLPGMDYLRGDMQIAHLFHSVAAILMMVLLLGHIYLGTIGVKGAYDGMRHGWVDEAWAQEHHALWYEDIKAGRIPAQRSGAAPAARPASANP
jgi:formate dehydrogenase subunit gamma